jgi:putative IMPACT (imprinted ancient) family translation regulator
LIRAYSHTAALAIKQAPISKKIITHTCKVTCDYDNVGNIDKIVREKTILDKVEYSSQVTFYFQTDEMKIDTIKQELFNNNKYIDRLEIIESLPRYVRIDY